MKYPRCPHCKQVVRRKFCETSPNCIDCGVPLDNARRQRCDKCRQIRRRESWRESRMRSYYKDPAKFIAYQTAWRARKQVAA